MIKAYISNTMLFGRQAVVLMPSIEMEAGVSYEYHILFPTGESSWRLFSQELNMDFGEYLSSPSILDAGLDFCVTLLSHSEETCLDQIHRLLSQLQSDFSQSTETTFATRAKLTEVDSKYAMIAIKQRLDQDSVKDLLEKTESNLLRKTFSYY